MWESIYVCCSTGGEGGIILQDEEYKELCNMTLEECAGYHAITCNIYGSMTHTVYCVSGDPESLYEAMKKDVQEFIDSNPSEDEESNFYEKFMKKYR
jgi:hypothetical protein